MDLDLDTGTSQMYSTLTLGLLVGSAQRRESLIEGGRTLHTGSNEAFNWSLYVTYMSQQTVGQYTKAAPAPTPPTTTLTSISVPRREQLTTKYLVMERSTVISAFEGNR